MSILDNALSRIMDSGDDRPLSERIADERRELKAEISELEDRVRYLGSDKGRQELLREAATPAEVGRRKRKLRDRLEGLREKDAELAERQKEAETEERAEDFEETVTQLPELADEFEAAERRLREVREELSEALVRTTQMHSRLKRTRHPMPAKLSPDHVERLESMLDRLPANFSRVNGGPLGHLRADDADEENADGSGRVYDATTGETYYPDGEPEGEPQVRRAEV